MYFFATANFNHSFSYIDDNYSKSLFHFDGADASTTFIDESGKTWAVYGNAQLDTAQYKFGGASGLFDGNGDYLTSPDNTDWYFASGNFTVDFWVRFNALPTDGNYQMFFVQRVSDTDRQFLGLYNTSGVYHIQYVVDSVDIINRAITVTTNTWYHIALVRSGNNWYVFQDGVQQGASSNSATAVDDISAIMYIGNYASANTYYLNGWLDELRISKGIARWTNNFTPPSVPYESMPTPTPIPTPVPSVDDSYTKVLLHFFGTNDSTTFADESGKAWTTYGDSKISTDAFEYGGTSGYFDGSGDYLRTPYTSDFDLSGDFTMDAWFNANNFNAAQVLISKDTYGSNYDWSILLINSTNIALYTNGTNTNLTVTVPAMSALTWYHIAYTKYSGIVSIYLNGIAYGSKIMSITNASQSYITIGCSSWNNPNTYFSGYIDELRISKGVARWTTNFNPPSTEYSPNTPTPTPTPVTIDDSYSKVLHHFNGVNNSNGFKDESGKPWFTYGNAVISTAQSKFGGSSGYFDGNGDYLLTPYTSDFDLSGGDFTLDTWFYSNSFASNQVIISKDTYGQNYDWDIRIANSTSIILYTNRTNTNLTVTVPAMNIQTWYHIAIVRSSGNVTIYLNGVGYGSKAMSVTNESQSYVTLGCAGWNNPGVYFNGYIDELRISKGIARWVSNFTPPTGEYGPLPTPTPTPTITPTPVNSVPVVSNVRINGGTSSINLSANTTTNVDCTASVTDADGYSNIQSVTAKLYRTGIGIEAGDNINNHYIKTGDSQCIPSSGLGLSEDYICTFAIYYLADPTDIGSINEDDNWSCTVTASDIVSTSAAVSVTTEMNTLTAIQVSSPLEYGTIDPGTTTGAVNKTITVTNVGNNILDLNILGTNMCSDYPSCAGNILNVGHQQFSLTSFTYGGGTVLTTSDQFLNANIAKPTANPSNSTQTLYWGLDIPSGQTKGNYTGQNTISALQSN